MTTTRDGLPRRCRRVLSDPDGVPAHEGRPRTLVPRHRGPALTDGSHRSTSLGVTPSGTGQETLPAGFVPRCRRRWPTPRRTTTATDHRDDDHDDAAPFSGVAGGTASRRVRRLRRRRRIRRRRAATRRPAAGRRAGTTPANDATSRPRRRELALISARRRARAADRARLGSSRCASPRLGCRRLRRRPRRGSRTRRARRRRADRAAHERHATSSDRRGRRRLAELDVGARTAPAAARARRRSGGRPSCAGPADLRRGCVVAFSCSRSWFSGLVARAQPGRSAAPLRTRAQRTLSAPIGGAIPTGVPGRDRAASRAIGLERGRRRGLAQRPAPQAVPATSSVRRCPVSPGTR